MKINISIDKYEYEKLKMGGITDHILLMSNNGNSFGILEIEPVSEEEEKIELEGELNDKNVFLLAMPSKEWMESVL